MLGEYKVYDSDAHVLLSPHMWESLPAKYKARQPRPVSMGEESELGRYNTGWFVDGKVLPHSVGPGAQPANTPRAVLEKFGASRDRPELPIGSLDLSDPAARLKDMDRLGLDVQFLFPTTLYAHLTSDAGFESALYRSYNRYVGNQCKHNSKRLKWAGLLPLRDPNEAIAAIEEMQLLGASAAVVYGTAGSRLLSSPKFSAIWDCFYRTGLPLCVHMGMSYPPLEELSQSIFDAHVLGMCLPAQLAFVAIVGHGMLDRYPNLKVAFLEFGAEWILYMVNRIDHYLPGDRRVQMPGMGSLPSKSVQEYLRSGNLFVGGEADDPYMLEEMKLLGDSQLLFSSDFPHRELRENSGAEILIRNDLSPIQKRKIFYDNALGLYGSI
jgi:predicted TIM-barrel fold metal-dependent hydrolase